MFRAGAAREIITPPLGTLLYGYPSKRISSSVRDDLTLTAIFVSDEKTKAILISACVASVSEKLVKEVKRRIKDQFGIEHVILCSTHTHSGPCTNPSAGWGTEDIQYVETIFLPKIVSACGQAIDNAVDAVVGIGYVESDVGINRRMVGEDGQVKLGENPWGIIDKKMYVIAFKGTDGKPICNMIHYGAHGTVAHGAEEPYITRDWSGDMVDRLEDYTGTLTVYFNGAEGDIAPRISYHSTNHRKQLGELGSRAGHDAIRAYREIKDYKPVEVKAYIDEIRLPYEELPALEKAKAELAKLDTEETLGMKAKEKAHWKAVVDLYENGNIETGMTFEQTIISIGEIAFVPFPFEPFTEVAMRLSHYSPFGYTLTLCNANGSNGYLPSRTEICRGGYEVWSFKHWRGHSLADDTDDTIIRENLKILRKMKEDN